MQALNLVGQPFGFLVVLSRGQNDKKQNTQWWCICRCGERLLVPSQQLKSGKTKSCGCLRRGGRPAIASGQVFGRLTVIKQTENDMAGNPQWLCRCTCGNAAVVRSYDLYGGQQSCGCFRLERLRAVKRTHGQSGKQASREYNAWSEMKRRCLDPKRECYKYYGGRGITIFPGWINNFSAFFEHIGPCPPGLELDRIDNNGNYEPGNVRWVTHKVNCDNRPALKNVKWIEYSGERLCVKDWAKRLGVNNTLLGRWLGHYGYSLAQVFAMKASGKFPGKKGRRVPAPS
jgi:hypothetical protein